MVSEVNAAFDRQNLSISDGRPYLRILETHLGERPTCPLPAYITTWLLRGIARNRLEGVDLAKALGLRRTGVDSIATRDRRDRRNRALRAAGALLDGDAAALAAAVRRFASGTWPRWKRLPFPPAQADEVQHHLFAAFQDGPLPNSIKQFERILSETSNQPY
jgi:hypothetical protein